MNGFGPNRMFYDGPGGRLMMGGKPTEEDSKLNLKEPRYDIVTIGGWSMEVAGIPAEAPRYGVETVNGYFGEKNHIFYRYLTAGQVERVSISWGRGTLETHFAIAAIVHGTRGLIPNYEARWWNQAVPAEILAARAIAENHRGGAITLRLTIGAF